jgi:hypothetical protein
MNTRILFVKRPTGWVDPSCFAIDHAAEADIGPQDVRVQALYLSTDPYLRGRMNEGPSYAPGFALGKPVVSRVVGRVIESRHAGFGRRLRLGLSRLGRTLGGAARRRPAPHRPGAGPDKPGDLGAGHARPHGLDRCHRPGPPQARRHRVHFLGRRHRGPVGRAVRTPRRCARGGLGGQRRQGGLRARQRCGFDAAFNYKTGDLDEALRRHCPGGIDVYFDNVGGTTLEAALRHANVGARFPVCGMISTYNEVGDAGVRGLQALLSKRICMTGFIIYDHVHQLPAYQARVAPWIRRASWCSTRTSCPASRTRRRR